MDGYYINFAAPWRLLSLLVLVPMIWLAWRNLGSLGPVRRVVALTLRALVVALLGLLLAEPSLDRKHEQVTLIAVVDRSQSIPGQLRKSSLAFLDKALAQKPAGDRLAVVDVAEAAMIQRLPSTGTELDKRAPSLLGDQSNLADGLQLGLAIAPSDSAVRFLLVSDGNETVGDLREAARVAAANGMPVDVLPLNYSYPQEVVFKRLVAPPTARAGQTVALRFVLVSTAAARGKLLLTLNGAPLSLAAEGSELAAAVELRPGTNVKTISVPIGSRGIYDFQATFVPDRPADDTLSQNNAAAAITFVAGPGHVLVVDSEDAAGEPIARALRSAGLDARSGKATDFPTQLADLLDVDAVLLVNTSSDCFSASQVKMMCQYVKEIGGGLVMVGGPQSFGAGGWIGSDLAEILPVDMDPPQKKQMPKGALVLIMHSCEMPQGNRWGKDTAIAAVRTLSQLDLVGIISYGWAENKYWDYPLAPVGSRSKVIGAINNMALGDMPDFGAPMKEAYAALTKCDAAQRHMIMISDGDPQLPPKSLLNDYAKAGITVSTVAVFPHSPNDVGSLKLIAQMTKGRFYNVSNPSTLPQIFVKEAQTVKRTLIMEKPFVPGVAGGVNEMVRGLGKLPKLEGYVWTGPKGGLAETLMTEPDGDPILASSQAGVGRCVAFTSSGDSRWAADWLAWGGYERFWEQIVRWVGKSSQSPDCEIFSDVQGRQVTVTVEAVDPQGNFVQFADILGQVIDPSMKARPMTLSQVGPGQYRATFQAGHSGNYLVNLRYKKAGQDSFGMAQSVVSVPYAPEFSDLSDNAALLAEVARETGGRVIGGDAAKADLFSRAGLVMPHSSLPLVRPLVILWLILFWLDVAARRVAIDVRALARKSWAALSGWLVRRPTGAGENLTKLKSTTKKLREQLSPKATGGGTTIGGAGGGESAAGGSVAGGTGGGAAQASRRFETADGDQQIAMPDAEPAAQKPAAATGTAAQQKPSTAGAGGAGVGGAGQGAAAEAGGGNLDRLLKARKRARDGMGDKKDEEKKS